MTSLTKNISKNQKKIDNLEFEKSLYTGAYFQLQSLINKLAKTEERLTLASRYGHVGFWDWDLKNNSFQWSSELYAIFGLDSRTVAPSLDTWNKLLYAEDRDNANKKVTEAINSNSALDNEYRIVKPSGTIHWIRALGNVQCDESGKTVRMSGVCLDITKQKMDEMKLEESEYFFRESQKAAYLGSYIANFVDDHWESSHVLDEIFGINNKYKRNVAGWMDLVHPDDKEMMNQYFNVNILQNKDDFNKEYRIVRKNDGETRWVEGRGKVNVDDKGVVISLMGTIQDITDRKIVEEELRNSENTFFSIFRTLPYGITITRKIDNSYIEINDLYCNIIGYTREEIFSKQFEGIKLCVNPSDVVKVMKDYKSDRGVINREMQFRRKNGEVFTGLFSAHPIFLSFGECILSSVVDITENKKNQIEIVRYKTLLDSAELVGKFGGFTYNLKTSDLTLTNGALAILEGDIDTDKIVYSDWANIVLPQYHKEIKKGMKSVATMGITNERDIEIMTKKGHTLWVHVVGTASRENGEIKTISGSIQDISERKQIEKRLQLSQENLSNVIVGAHAGTWDWNIQTGALTINDRWAEMLGYTIKELEPISIKTWEALAHPDDLIKSNKLLEEHVLGKINYYSFESRMKHKDGSWIWVSDNGKITEWDTEGKALRAAGIHIDITKQKIADEKILELNERNQAIIASIGDGVMAVDQNGIVTVLNISTEKMIGYKIEESIGKHYAQILHMRDEDGTAGRERFIEDIIHYNNNNNNKTIVKKHFILNTSNKLTLPISCTAATILDSQGKGIGGVIVLHDIAKEYEIDKAKTEFVSLASHQLRTPLSTINWYTEMLLSKEIGELNPKQSQYTQEVYHASRRMVALVNSLLNVSRIEMGSFIIDPKPCSVVEIAQTCIKDISPMMLKKNITLKTTFAPHIKLLNVDPKLMTMLFQNLLSNSIKYSKIGSEIDLSVAIDTESLLVTVTDTGIGIPENQQKNIFKKLYRADNAKKIDPDGSGLGLYIINEFMMHSGGRVWFSSKEGDGTVFYASLPLSGMKQKVGDIHLSN